MYKPVTGVYALTDAENNRRVLAAGCSKTNSGAYNDLPILPIAGL